MEDFEKNDAREEVFSKSVRAGKRTYFFDVKTTRNNDHYLTITESKRKFNNENGKFFYEKHKVFLYKEDFEKFQDGLKEALEYIKTVQPEFEEYREDESTDPLDKATHINVSFEDLGDEND